MTRRTASRSLPRLKPVARAAAFAAATTLTTLAHAGPGFVDATLQDGSTVRLQTYFAYSPSGARATAVGAEEIALAAAEGRAPNFTGAALRKFIDPLPLPGAANARLMADGLTKKYIPVAAATKWVSPNTGAATGDDYYEIGVVEYSDRFHTDLRKVTTLRGYVQIDHLASNNRGQVPGSKKFPLTYPDGSPILIAATDAKGFLSKDAAGNQVMVQALAVDEPRFLGPVITATKDTPTRVKFMNLLPAGRAEYTVSLDANGKNVFTVSKRNGDLFLPTDKSIFGAGIGPDGLTEYTQNRVSVHLHGGDTPWISDGTPHQWITPAGEADAANPKSLAARFNDPTLGLDPALLPDYLRGASTANVPDMPDPGVGAYTLYYPNGQTARTLWYHDHTFGSTRLNVYSGMASGYLLTDTHEQQLIQAGTLPAADKTIPLVLQDRTFVPDDISLQDARWNTSAWGAPGDSWFPHVYETVQDPAQANSWNAVGRWHYGPWFWPVYPSLYPLPEGTYSPEGYENTTTTTPEAWMDTPIINGVAYPVLEVDPAAYRFKILNASNDRMFTFGFYQAKDTVTLADGTVVSNAVTDPATGLPIPSEVEMVPAAPSANTCAAGVMRPQQDANGNWCQPDFWPTDNRVGGMPNPASVGPTIYQVGSEGGFLPRVATIEPSPITYLQDKGRVNVLNVNTKSLFIAPAERADIVVDFSAYAGQTLIVYNDSGAPIPASDPRNDTFTGAGDQSGAGGAEDTRPGYGPNIRTMMLVRVKAAAGPVTPLDVAALKSGVTAAFVAGADRPVVAQPAYAGVFNEPTWAGIAPTANDSTTPAAYANIYTATLKQPTFHFTPGRPDNAINGVDIQSPGAGYVQAPAVSIAAPAAPGGIAATAAATMNIEKFIVTAGGSGYTTAPLFSVVGGGGNGATGTATLGINRVTPSNGGSGYTSAPTVSFSAPPAGGTKPVATAVVSAGKVVAINVSTNGRGYTAAPLVTLSGGGGTGAKASSSGYVDNVKVDVPYPATPTVYGGGGYLDLDANSANPNITPIVYTFTGGGGTGANATATGRVFNISLTHPGNGYAANENPAVTVGAAPAGGTTATATANAATSNYLVKNKGIQELFDPTYGRLNATFSVELPYTSGLSQTTIPLAYVDAPTERFADGETQIWKITHNGVDTHPVHFHLLNVQVINRVGWDGYIMPPNDNELGWKETVKMSPLEDIIVAVKAKRPPLPGFGLPASIRPMDPSQPLDSPFGFSQVDPTTGMPAVVTNQVYNYGWEYTWHCHILGHEENDFMRPWAFDAKDAPTKAPNVNPAAPVLNADGSVTVRWADATPYGVAASLTDASAEVGFRVERAIQGQAAYTVLPDGLTTVRGLTSQINTLANVTSYIDKTPLLVTAPTPANMPTISGVLATQVTVNWTLPAAAAGSAPVVSFNVWRAEFDPVTDAVISAYAVVNAAPIPKTAAANYSYTDNTVSGGAVYRYIVEAVSDSTVPVVYRVAAVNVKGETFSTVSDKVNFPSAVQSAQSASSDKAVTPIGAPTWNGTGVSFSNQNNVNSATFTWNPARGAVSYQVQWKQGTSNANGVYGGWITVNGTSFTASGITANNWVTFQIRSVAANNSTSVIATTTPQQFSLPAVPGAVTSWTPTTSSLGIAWAAVNGATGYVVKIAGDQLSLAGAPSFNTSVPNYVFAGLNPNVQYWVQMASVKNGLQSAFNTASSRWTLANGVTAAPTVVAQSSNTAVTLNWTAATGGATSYRVDRSTTSNFATVTSTVVAGSVTTLDSTGVAAGLTLGSTVYYFRVVALSGQTPTAVAAAASPTASAGGVPVAPAGNVTAANGTVSLLNPAITGGLTWTNVPAASGGATSYQVQWSNTADMASPTMAPATSGQQINVGGAARTVYMQVRAVGPSGSSAWVPAAPVAVLAR